MTLRVSETVAEVKRVAISVGMLLAMAGCAATNTLMGGNTRQAAAAEAEWSFAPKAVQIEVEADASLNEYAGEPHTLILGVYQVDDSASFYKVATDANLITKSLQSGVAGEGVTHFSRYVVRPGQRAVLSIDRAQRAKFIGVVAGYYQVNSTQNARLFGVPLTITREGFIRANYKAEPNALAFRLKLGPAEVVNAQRLDSGDKKARFQDSLDGVSPRFDPSSGRLQEAGQSSESLMKLK